MDGSNSGAAAGAGGAVASTAAGDGNVDNTAVSGGGGVPPPTIASSSVMPAGEDEDQQTTVRVDPVTALQDSIDSLSLSMFEALRGLRDAVAPESGNLGGGQNNNNDGNGKASNNNTEVENSSYEEFWQAYKNGDPGVVATVDRLSPNNKPTKTADYVRIHSRLEIEKDAVLVAKLARTVLEKSTIIDDRVSTLPGMNRSQAQQFAYIKELIEKNNDASKRLEVAYTQAHQQRNEIRTHIMNHTSTSLGISEDLDDGKDGNDQ